MRSSGGSCSGSTVRKETTQQEKLNALDLRFTEGPSNDPLQLPVELCLGKEAFHRPSFPYNTDFKVVATDPQARFACEVKTFFQGSVESTATPSEHGVLESLRDLLFHQQELNCAIDRVMKYASRYAAADRPEETKGTLERLMNSVDTVQASAERFHNLYVQTLERLQEFRNVSIVALNRVKALTANCCVERFRVLREIERFQLFSVAQKYPLRTIMRPRKEPVMPSRILSVEQLEGLDGHWNGYVMPKEILRLIREAHHLSATLAENSGSQGEDTTVKDDFTLDHVAPFTDEDGPDPAAAALAIARYLVPWQRTTTASEALPTTWKKRIACETRKGWSNYEAIVKRLRRLADEQSSPYRHFPLLDRKQPIRLLNMLGKGGFAEVWQGLHLDTLKIHAIKITELHEEASSEEKEFILGATCREVTLQRTLKHPNVVEMQQCFEITPSIFAACLDMCPGGSLDRYIQECGPVNERLAARWMTQILEALDYIHTVGNAVHFDLKPLNILLHENGSLKIADFGLHQPLGPEGYASLDMSEEHNHVGTVWYMPPEHLRVAILQDVSRFDGRFDIWSAGILLYELLFQRRPFGHFSTLKGLSGNHVAAVLYGDILYAQKQHKLELPLTINPISESCQKFLLNLLQPVNTRPTARALLLDPFLQKNL